MVVRYCGNCGAAARPQVHFCRQCGVELERDSASPSAPLRAPVEVRARASGLGKSQLTEANTENLNGDTKRQTATSAPLSPSLNRESAAASSRAPDNKGVNGRQPRSSALAQASGLEGASAFSSRIRTVLIAVALLIVAVASIVYYRQSLLSLRIDRPERNLVTPEDKSLELIRLGKQSNEFGQYEMAISQFKEALVLTPQHLPIYLLLAQSYQASGQVDEALRAYWTLLRQEPRNLEARLEVAEVHRARGNWREAYQEYQRIIDINSQSLEAIAALAVIEAHDQRPDGLARSDLTKHRAVTRHKMASIVPALPGAGLTARLALPRLEGGSLSAPPALLTRTRDEERDDERALAVSHKELGVRYLNVREYIAALKEFSIAKKLTPDDKDLYYMLGSVYNGLKQPALAHELYKQCDSGDYAEVSQSAAQKIAKAARNETKKQTNSAANVDILPSTRPSTRPGAAHGLK